MATVFEDVVVNSVDEDGRFMRVCSNPVKVEVVGTASETSLKLFDGEKWIVRNEVRVWKSHKIRYDTIRYIYVRPKADEMASLV